MSGAFQSNAFQNNAFSTVTVTLQYARPASDGTNQGWTNESGGSTNLYDSINETVANSADWIQSEVNPNSRYVEFPLSALGTPPNDDNHAIAVEFQKIGSNNRLDLTIGLYQGTTLIKEQTYTDIGTTLSVYTISLSAGEAGSISNYSDLKVRLTANRVD